MDAAVAGTPVEAGESVAALAAYLGGLSENPYEDAYAAYRWIRDNISPDVEAAVGDPIASSGQEADQVLARRTAVCAGYSQLLSALVRGMGLDARVVHGIGVITTRESAALHDWNAVGIDGAWYLVEPSWSNNRSRTGSGDRNYFFMTDPARFVLRHLPENSQWQLLEPPVSDEEFWGGL